MRNRRRRQADCNDRTTVEVTAGVIARPRMPQGCLMSEIRVPTLGESVKNLFNALRLLLLDLASTLFFVVLYLLTHNIPLAIAVGILLGFAQIGWQIARKN